MAASFSRTLFFAIQFFAFTALSAADSPVPSPSLPPQPPANEISPPPTAASSAPTPSPSPSFSSPPAPPPSDLAPNSPSPSQNKSPSPAPNAAGETINENQTTSAGDKEAEKESSGGMNGGQKAGVAVGVIAGACIVGSGALLYKKRQQNIQRSQYGYAARREIL